MSRFLSSRFSGKKGYQFGERPKDREYIKLNSNESPFPPSGRVIAAVTDERLREQNLYADPCNAELCGAAAEYYGVMPEQVLADSGSDVLLSYCLLAYGSGNEGFRFPDITYTFYKTTCQAYDVNFTEVPLREDFTIRWEDYVSCGSGVLIANPNAPTGFVLSPEQIERIVSSNPDHVVIIDEAYVDFGNRSSIPLLKKYDNLIVIQTMSKSRSLAGARIGFAFSSPEIIGDLSMLRAAFNPDSMSILSQAIGCAAIRDDEYLRRCTEQVIRTREDFRAALLKRGFEVLKSNGNFLLARTPRMPAARLYRELKKNGVLVRYFDQPRVRDYIRISIGTDRQMKEVLDRLGRILEQSDEAETGDARSPQPCGGLS